MFYLIICILFHYYYFFFGLCSFIKFTSLDNCRIIFIYWREFMNENRQNVTKQKTCQWMNKIMKFKRLPPTPPPYCKTVFSLINQSYFTGPIALRQGRTESLLLPIIEFNLFIFWYGLSAFPVDSPKSPPQWLDRWGGDQGHIAGLRLVERDPAHLITSHNIYRYWGLAPDVIRRKPNERSILIDFQYSLVLRRNADTRRNFTGICACDADPRNDLRTC